MQPGFWGPTGGTPERVLRKIGPGGSVPLSYLNYLFEQAGSGRVDPSVLHDLAIVEVTRSEDFEARYLHRDRSGEDWETAATLPFENLLASPGFPGEFVPRGERVTVMRHRQSGKAVPVNWPELVRFELLTALTPGAGNTATAALLEYGEIPQDEESETEAGESESESSYSEMSEAGEALAYHPNYAIEFTVVDPHGHFRGRARATGGLAHTVHGHGSYGLARYFGDKDAMEIVWLQPHAQVIRATVSGEVPEAESSGKSSASQSSEAYSSEGEAHVAVTDSTFYVEDVVVVQPAGGLLMSTPTQVNNILRHPSHYGYGCIAWFNEDTGEWDGIPRMAWGPC